MGGTRGSRFAELRRGRRAPGSRRFPGSLPGRQTGALGIMGALVLGLSVLFTALAVDAGRLMLEQRRLQKIADMAALDAASHGGGCGDGTLASVIDAAQLSAMQNGYAGDLGSEGGVETGVIDVGGGIRTFAAADPEASTAVRVTTRNVVPASLVAGGIFGNTTLLQATATAERSALGAISAGSGLLELNSEDSALLNLLLGKILGSSIQLDAVHYNGLANTDVTLLQLVNASADIGTVHELLAADLGVGDLLNLYASALDGSAVLDVNALLALQELISANVSDLSVRLGDILNITVPDVESAGTVALNLFDLVTATAIVANGDHALTLPLQINNLLGLNVEARLEVIEPPQIAIGPPGKDEDGEWRTQLHTAQVRLDTDVTGGLNLLVASVDVDLRLRLQVAQGSAWLQSIRCRSLDSPTSVVTIGAEPGILGLAISRTNPGNAPLNPGKGPAGLVDVKLLGLPIAKVDVGLDLPLQEAGADDLVYEVESKDDLPLLQSTDTSLGGGLDNGLGNLADSLDLDVTLLGAIKLSLEEILAPVVGGLLRPLLSALAKILLDPLLKLLGINLGIMDVNLLALEVGRPELLI